MTPLRTIAGLAWLAAGAAFAQAPANPHYGGTLNWGTVYVTGTGTLKLTAGDTVQPMLFQSTGASGGLTVGAAIFSLTRIA